MSIRNFFVRVKGVKFEDKGMLNLLRYLTDKKRHPKGIVNFEKYSNAKEYFLRVYRNVNEYNIQKRLNNVRGRGISSWGDSYIFSFPKGLKIEKEKYRKIIKDLTSELWKQFNKQLGEENKSISLDEFTSNMFFNIHTNDHIHINVVFSRILEVKENEESVFYNNRITNRKKFLNISKGIFNKIIFENFNLDIDNYKPNNNKKGYKNIYIHKQMKRLEDKKNEVENEILKLEELLKLKRSERKREIEKIELEKNENNRKEKIVKSFNLLLRYFNRLIEKYENNVLILNDDYNSVIDKVEEIEGLTKNKRIREMTDTIKNKSKRIYGLKF